MLRDLCIVELDLLTGDIDLSALSIAFDAPYRYLSLELLIILASSILEAIISYLK